MIKFPLPRTDPAPGRAVGIQFPNTSSVFPIARSHDGLAVSCLAWHRAHDTYTGGEAQAVKLFQRTQEEEEFFTNVRIEKTNHGDGGLPLFNPPEVEASCRLY